MEVAAEARMEVIKFIREGLEYMLLIIVGKVVPLAKPVVQQETKKENLETVKSSSDFEEKDLNQGKEGEQSNGNNSRSLNATKT